MASTLGEKLRQAREARDISISEVAEQTRISPLYIESIENDDYRPLPGGIFNKGFVKSYAKVVGVDENEALADYLKIITQQEGVQDDEPKTYRPEVLTDDRRSSSTLLTIIFAVVILGLMTWGILALVSYVKENSFQATTPTPTNTNNSTNSNTADSSQTNTNANVSQPMPSTNEIKVEIKPTAEKINVTSIVDGKKVSEDVLPDAPKTYTGQQSVRILYYRGFTADKVQITLNGKQVTPPNPPAKGNNIIIEINKDNISQILQSGQIIVGNETQPATSPTPIPR